LREKKDIANSSQGWKTIDDEVAVVLVEQEAVDEVEDITSMIKTGIVVVMAAVDIILVAVVMMTGVAEVIEVVAPGEATIKVDTNRIITMKTIAMPADGRAYSFL
jgi:hypothetical protein